MGATERGIEEEEGGWVGGDQKIAGGGTTFHSKSGKRGRKQALPTRAGVEGGRT